MGLVRTILFISIVGWGAAYFRHPESWTSLVAALACVAAWALFELDRGRRAVNKMIEGDDPLDPR